MVEWAIGIVVAGLGLLAAYWQGREKGKHKEQEKQLQDSIDMVRKADDAKNDLDYDDGRRGELYERYKRDE